MPIALNETTVAQAAAPATYKLVVRSADEAVKAIREQLGENARVLSVRQLPSQGLAGLLGRPRLEVIAQIATPELPVAMQPALGLPADDRPASMANPFSLDRSRLGSRDMPAGLGDLLRRSGFSASLVGRLEAAPELSGHDMKPLHRVLVDVGTTLGAAARRRAPRPLPSRAAFIGSPGSGRTTALCKWLAREMFSHHRTGRVFKAEFDRPNPSEGLGVFCEALGLVLEHAVPDSPLPQSGTEFAYVDMPAMSVRRPQDNRPLLRYLDTAQIEGRVLILNALYDQPVLRDAYAAGRDLGATHLVFTHLDELEHWGRLWDFLIEGELSPLFLSTGSGLTGDLVPDVVGAVMRRTLPGAPVPHLS
ncbi:flagellar GTP-binding protein [Rariglobus hedericola]|uniref:Flagellar GTP-binding protein n=1 Tax=Rariglobus hedericola TaxID=2597822 RepID=A0A556QPS3_9BACT|nr:flagellar GTP-binding protein [Rariglobus hedericola]TSJ78640.1 flagellar GTP-binding protein [Rariglobus hedericola]